MKAIPRISEAELILMEIIWTHSPISGSDVVSHLDEQSSWHFRTVKTMLGRLVKKGALTYKKDKKVYLYSPLISRQQYIDDASKTFIKRTFGGNHSLALTHFVETTDLDEGEVEQLKTLLESKPRK